MKTNLLVAAGAGVVVGAVAVRCLQKEAIDEDEDEGLLEAAFSAVQTEEVKGDIIDMVIKEEEEKRQATLLRMASVTSTAGSESPSELAEIAGDFEDKVKGVVGTNAEGARVFKRPELGLEFQMSKAWYGLDEYSQPQDTGATWVARFGDPTAAPTPMARQLVLIVEQVGEGCTIEDYATKSKVTCQETMGRFSQVNFTEDGPFGIGPFTRKLVYNQVIPTPNMMVELKFLNYMTVANGIAYTLQLMAPAQLLTSCLGDMDETARGMKISSCEWRPGVIVHTKDLDGGKTVTVNVPTEMLIAEEDAPTVLSDAFAFGGDIVDNFLPMTHGSMVTVLHDRDEAMMDQGLKEMAEDKMPEGYKLLKINSPDPMFLEALMLLPNNEVMVTITVRQVRAVRVVAWSLVPDIDTNDIPEDFFRSRQQIAMMQQLALKFTEGTRLDAESKAGTYYTHPKHGLSFTISPTGLLREHHFGDMLLSYSVSRESPLPELQVLKQDRKIPVEDWLKEVKMELTQAGGTIDEQTEGHLGREKMRQLVIRVPQPMEEPGRPPAWLRFFVTLLCNENGAYMLQWRSSEADFSKHRSVMEDVLTTFKFFPPRE